MCDSENTSSTPPSTIHSAALPTVYNHSCTAEIDFLMSVSERSRLNSELDGEAEEAGMLWYECDMNSLVDEIARDQRTSGLAILPMHEYIFQERLTICILFATLQSQASCLGSLSLCR